MPQYDAVVAITSGTSDLQGVMNLVWDRIVPALGDATLPADPDSDRRLAEKLASLSLPVQAGQVSSQTADRVTGRTFTFPENPQHIEALSLKTAGDGAETLLTLRIAGVDQRIECGQGSWTKGSITLETGEAVPVAASGAWSSGDTYSVRLVRYRTPFSTDYDARFTGDGVILEAMDNVGLVAPVRVRLSGTAQP
jgi:hypothetical protein